MNTPHRFYGKYRGTVTQNIDPEQRGRIQAIVPDVSGMIPTSWAMPCVPVAGPMSGHFALPQIGAGVWIEFEQGDPDYPVWTGCYWSLASEVPALAASGNPASPSMVLQSGLQHSISISDMPGPGGGIMLRSTTGAMIVVNDVGITISNGQGASIVLTGPTVTVNSGALVVT